MILGYDFWQRRFGGDRAIVGQTIQLNGRPQPSSASCRKASGCSSRSSRSRANRRISGGRTCCRPTRATPRGRYMQAIARLKPGVSVTRAQTELSAIAAALATEFPARNAGWGARVLPLHAQLSGEYRTALLVLSGAVAFVLLIACANVANLLLARGAARQREIAIRIRARRGAFAGRAPAADRKLRARCVLGGALGLLVAQWGVALLLAISPVDLNTTGTVSLSYPVLAVHGHGVASDGDRAADSRRHSKDRAPSSGDAEGRRAPGRRRACGIAALRQAFVVAEIALAVVLLVGAGLMLRSFGSLAACQSWLQHEQHPDDAIAAAGHEVSRRRAANPLLPRGDRAHPGDPGRPVGRRHQLPAAQRPRRGHRVHHRRPATAACRAATTSSTSASATTAISRR